MELSEYLDRLTGQMRCKKARPMVEEEIRLHIEDQAGAYRAAGMEEQAALAAAVREMGDPVEAGTMLDRVHRPKTEWSVLLLVGVLSLVGLALQYLFYDRGSAAPPVDYFARQLGYTVIGLCCMALMYRLDYTLIGRYALPLWALLFLASLLVFTMPGWKGVLYLCALAMLYVPVYAGILFRFRDGGAGKLAVCLLLLVFPFYTALRSSRGAATLITVFVCLILLSVAVARGWFQVKKGRTIALIWAAAAALPAILLISAVFSRNGLHLLADYQVARIQAFLHPRSDIMGAGYQMYHLRELVGQLKLVGTSIAPDGYSLPNMQNDYVIMGLFSYYGILAGIAVVGLVLFFLFRILRIAWKQKNQLGSMMGLACALLIASQSLIYLYANFRGSLVSQLFMPFLSYGLTGTVLNFILIGIFLSVHRGSTITDEGRIKRETGYRYRIRITREEE